MGKFSNSLFSLMLLTTACSSAPVLFDVKSEPLQADVFFKAPDSDEKKPLGKTPLSMPMTEVKKIVGNDAKSGQFLTIIVEKSGFVSQTYMIPATAYGLSIISLDVKLKTGADKEQRLAKDILDRLMLAQKFALSQQYERANIELDKILNDVPEFPQAMSMRAAIFFAQKNFPESLKWYENVLKVDPKDDEVVKMIAKVKTLQSGGRLPASAEKPGEKPPEKKADKP